MVGTSENIGNYKQRTVRVTPLLVCIWDCICNSSKRCYRGNGGTKHCTTGRCIIGIFINDEKQFRQKIRAVPGKRKYIIYQQEAAETVRIRLVKLTEEQYGNVWITNLITDAPEQDTPYTKNILPEIFPYIQNEVPDLIVCNLGTNDASYVRQIPSRERAFVEKYTDFIQQLKKVFADAKMLLLYGLMEQTLCEKVQETAQRCGTEFLKLPLQNPVNGMGTDGHPGARTQQEIALYVERYMEQMMMWRTDER